MPMIFLCVDHQLDQMFEVAVESVVGRDDAEASDCGAYVNFSAVVVAKGGMGDSIKKIGL